MVDPDRPNEGAPPREVHVGPEHHSKGLNWLAWLALLAGILALLFALSRCNRDDGQATAPAVTNEAAVAGPVVGASSDNAGSVVASTPNASSAEALAGTSAVGGFLAGTEPTPRTFQFEKLNFDTAKSVMRPADAAEVNQVAATLKQYGNARIRIAGYADDRGPDPANMALGKARADAIKAALVSQGVAASRIETVSGGEKDPVASNATEGGRFENRRTELVVTSR
jgi:outer membrane protein OmpA-like peptidoglycan-associated protein